MEASRMMMLSSHPSPVLLPSSRRRCRNNPTRFRRGIQNVPLKVVAMAEESTGVAEKVAIAGGLISNPIIGWSLYTLKTTGCGLPPGPGGSIGALEGVSYLAVVGIVGWSLYTKSKTGSGLPNGPFGLLGAVEGLSYLALLGVIVVFGLQFLDQGFIPGAVPVPGGTSPLFGHALVIAGTLGFALSNVGEEFFVEKKDLTELLAMLGIFGMFVSICQILLVERSNLEAIKWSPEVISLFGGFAVPSFIYYSVVPYVLKFGGSVLHNLSILTSDVWIHWLYYLSFVIVVLVLVIYSTTDRNVITAMESENRDDNAQYQILDEVNEGSPSGSIVMRGAQVFAFYFLKTMMSLLNSWNIFCVTFLGTYIFWVPFKQYIVCLSI